MDDFYPTLSRLTAMRLALVLLAAGLVLGFIVRDDRSLAGDAAMLEAIQAVQFAGLSQTLSVVNFIGSSAGGILAAAVLIVVGQLSGNARYTQQVLIVTGLRLAGEVLKPMFGSPRPPFEYLREADRALTTYGYPSGHAFTYTCISGLLVVLAANLRTASRWRWTLVVAAGVLLLSGLFTRPWLGLHWPYDMVGGFLFGSAAVLIAVAIIPVEPDPAAT